MCRGSTLLLASLAAVLVKVVALKIDTVAVPELLREMMLWSSRDAVTEPRLEFFFCVRNVLSSMA